MEFKRKKKHGVSQKVCRLWFSPEGYRITWRKEAWGVKIQPGFHACVRTIMPGNFEGGSTLIWDFVNPHKHLYRSLKVAMADCKHHKRLWSKAAQCPGIRSIRELFGGKEPRGIPKGVFNKLDRRVVEILMDTTPHRQADDYREEPEAPPVEAMPFPEDTEPKKRRKRRSKKTQPITPESETRKRKQRSDKGKPRGSRKLKPAATETQTTKTPAPEALPRKRKQRSDKGKPRGPRGASEVPTVTDTTEPVTKKRRTRSDKGKKRGPRGPYGPRKPRNQEENPNEA